MVGFTVKSVNFIIFENSYDDPSVAIAQAREAFSFGKTGVDMSYGLMHGYHGRLEERSSIPNALRPLFAGEIDPVVALSPYYQVSKRFEVRAIITVGFSALGMKFLF